MSYLKTTKILPPLPMVEKFQTFCFQINSDGSSGITLVQHRLMHQLHVVDKSEDELDEPDDFKEDAGPGIDPSI